MNGAFFPKFSFLASLEVAHNYFPQGWVGGWEGGGWMAVIIIYSTYLAVMISFIFREMKEYKPVFKENVTVIFGANVK